MSRNLSRKRTLAKRNETILVTTFLKKYEVNSTSGATFSLYKKSCTFGAKDDLKDVECYKCHKRGVVNKCPENRPKTDE